MSERGSFGTEFIYCGRCLKTVQECIDQANDDGFAWYEWSSAADPRVMAGRVSGLHSGGEHLHMEETLKPLLDSRLCHKVRIAVHADNGYSEIYECGSEPEQGPSR